GLDDNFTKILDVDIPYLKLPIFPGKNVTVIAEVISLNYLLKHYGYNAAKVFTEKLRESLKKKVEETDRSIHYFENDFE
ncbi:MAG: HPr kinase/phosphorylase, partial [Candidatus Kapaibacterium sp.]